MVKNYKELDEAFCRIDKSVWDFQLWYNEQVKNTWRYVGASPECVNVSSTFDYCVGQDENDKS